MHLKPFIVGRAFRVYIVPALKVNLVAPCKRHITRLPVLTLTLPCNSISHSFEVL
jgi:hypothetical protein